MAIKDRARLDDHYSRKARQEGFPARSVYKLEEIDQKYKLLRPGQNVLDLGCAPGSWSLYAAGKVGSKGRVIGIDLELPDTAFPPQVTILQGDLLENPVELVHSAAPFDLVLSDMAPKTMGRREVDQARSLDLCRMAWAWAETMLAPSGHFLFKLFQSQDGDDFVRTLKPRFSQIVRLKPKATRSQSLEIFVLGMKYCGPQKDESTM
ncbi:MAG: RlmE family RNA methyltransferase [Candidatus Adiutrix sp.]|jgi:23S rRNA (uridine2552-2'-O)-methyltransferase|nr:RlmE family RNA methyltransferase [Candidatus Adiutrix sp.]